MKVQVRYHDNRYDIFDTSIFTKAEPFAGQAMLTNFEVRFDQLGDTGLWLAVHSYDANPAYRDEERKNGMPVARRKNGWCFLLVAKREIDSIESVCVDGETMLQGIHGELVDVLRINALADAWLDDRQASLAERIVSLYETMTRIMSTSSATPSKVARACGCSLDLIELLQLSLRKPEEADVGTDDNSGNWMEGICDEDIG